MSLSQYERQRRRTSNHLAANVLLITAVLIGGLYYVSTVDAKGACRSFPFIEWLLC